MTAGFINIRHTLTYLLKAGLFEKSCIFEYLSTLSAFLTFRFAYVSSSVEVENMEEYVLNSKI